MPAKATRGDKSRPYATRNVGNLLRLAGLDRRELNDLGQPEGAMRIDRPLALIEEQPAPSSATLVGDGWLTWRQLATTSDEEMGALRVVRFGKKRAPRGKDLAAFLRFWSPDVPNSALLDFARTRGALKLCPTCGDPELRLCTPPLQSHVHHECARPAPPSEVGVRRRWSRRDGRPWAVGWYTEPAAERLSDWRAWSWRFRALLAAVAHLHLVEMGHRDLGATIALDERRAIGLSAVLDAACAAEGGRGEIDVGTAWFLVERTLEHWLSAAGVRVGAVVRHPEDGRPQIRRGIRVPSVFGLLVALVAEAVDTVGADLAPLRCEACGCVVEHRPRRGSRVWCKEPGCQRRKKATHKAEERARNLP